MIIQILSLVFLTVIFHWGICFAFGLFGYVIMPGVFTVAIFTSPLFLLPTFVLRHQKDAIQNSDEKILYAIPFLIFILEPLLFIYLIGLAFGHGNLWKENIVKLSMIFLLEFCTCLSISTTFLFRRKTHPALYCINIILMVVLFLLYLMGIPFLLV